MFFSIGLPKNISEKQGSIGEQSCGCIAAGAVDRFGFRLRGKTQYWTVKPNHSIIATMYISQSVYFHLKNVDSTIAKCSNQESLWFPFQEL